MNEHEKGCRSVPVYGSYPQAQQWISVQRPVNAAAWKKMSVMFIF